MKRKLYRPEASRGLEVYCGEEESLGVVKIMVKYEGEKSKCGIFQCNSIMLHNDLQHVLGHCTNFGHFSVGWFRTLETSTQSNADEAEAQITWRANPRA